MDGLLTAEWRWKSWSRAAFLLAIRQNKAVQMEIVCHRYEEEWKFIQDSPTAEARWRVKDRKLMGNGRELT